MSYLTGHWSFDPFLVVVVAWSCSLTRSGWPGCGPARTHGGRGLRRWRSLLFYGGLACLLVAVESPIDYWSDDYFFVHMIEHILISFYAPILIVAGAPWIPLLFAFPVGLRRRLGRALLLGSWARPLRAVGRVVMNPWTALGAFNAAMVLWHFPALFDLAENNQSVHIWLMHGTFLVTGVLFWLQIIPSHPMRPRASFVWQGGAIIATEHRDVRAGHVPEHLHEHVVVLGLRPHPGGLAVPVRRSADRGGHLVGVR